MEHVTVTNHVGDSPTCPHCGYCPHCGRGRFSQSPYYPQWPAFPPAFPHYWPSSYPIYCTTTAVSDHT